MCQQKLYKSGWQQFVLSVCHASAIVATVFWAQKLSLLAALTMLLCMGADKSADDIFNIKLVKKYFEQRDFIENRMWD